MRTSCTACTSVLLSAVALAQMNSTPQALNITPYNLIAQAPGGPILYYNGSGDVPSYYETSPDPSPITPIVNSTLTATDYYNQILNITNGTGATDNNCTQCIMGAEVIHQAASTLQVADFVELLIDVCEAQPAVQATIYAVNCRAEYGSVANDSIPYSSGGAGIGAFLAQLFVKMNNDTLDMQSYCHYNFGVCPQPPLIGIDESLYFSPKPESSEAPPPSDKSINVLHLSDWHLDPRYDIGSEANCSQYLCCRNYATNTALDTTSQNASIPASRFGYLYCDAPPDLALSAFSNMPQFFDLEHVYFAIFTGDIVSHDNDDQLSRAYVEYEETITYQTFKAWLGNIPLYPTLGNHDSWPEAFNTENTLNVNDSASGNAMGWNYELLMSLWQNSSWINSTEASYGAAHYAAYAHTVQSPSGEGEGLRIISFNSDFYYKSNIFNYWNTTNPDTSGMLKWIADELTACEVKGQRAWIIAHVLSGYDGSQPLPNPTALFYSIVRRFSPTTIAGIFFGHTHEDQLQIFYDYLPYSTYTENGVTLRNTTMVDYSKPLQMGFIGPSITPLTGLNSGYQMYQVDAETYSVMGIQTYFANVSESLTWTTPVWQFEYDARNTYGNAASTNGSAWPETAPLNATFWNQVTESMLSNHTLVEMYNLYETKSSVTTKNCSSAACAKQKVCYIRSGSAALGQACGKKNGPY